MNFIFRSGAFYNFCNMLLYFIHKTPTFLCFWLIWTFVLICSRTLTNFIFASSYCSNLLLWFILKACAYKIIYAVRNFEFKLSMYHTLLSTWNGLTLTLKWSFQVSEVLSFSKCNNTLIEMKEPLSWPFRGTLKGCSI